MGELHLEIIVDRLVREFSVAANVGKPQVAYRETVRKKVEKIQGKFVRQTGGRGQYGDAVISLEPNPGKGYEFDNKIIGGVIPKEYIKSVDEGIREAMESGTVAGYPVVDVKATLTFGSYHDVDSSEIAFKVAGSMAFKAAMPQGRPDAARAGLRGRGRDARGVHGRRHRRPLLAARPDPEHGAARQGPDRHGARAALHDVRLRDHGALADARAARPTRCSSQATRKSRRRSPTRSSRVADTTGISEPSGLSIHHFQGVRTGNGQAEVRADEAASQHRHHRSHRPREDDADGCDHEGARGARGRLEQVRRLRQHRQGSRGARARHHDLDRARRVRDREAPLRARRLPGSRRLHQEHDHGRRADGRRDPRRLRRRRPHAADARAHPAGPPGRRAVHRRRAQQGRHGRRPRAPRAGRARGARAALEVRVPGRRHPRHPGLGAQGARGRQGVGATRSSS